MSIATIPSRRPRPADIIAAPAPTRAAKEWRATLVRDSATIREAISAIDDSALQIALVVDAEQRLVGTVTDGDVRRGLLRGITLDTAVADIMNRRPAACPAALGREAALAVMRSADVKQVPLLDPAGRVVGLEIIGGVVKRTERDNWVVLMAGGLGQRLRPLTEDCPKPMLPVGGQPILEIILKNFARQGFSRFFLSVNYKAEMVRDHFADGARWDVQIDYLEEREKLGTAGALGLLPEQPAKAAHRHERRRPHRHQFRQHARFPSRAAGDGDHGGARAHRRGAVRRHRPRR